MRHERQDPNNLVVLAEFFKPATMASHVFHGAGEPDMATSPYPYGANVKIYNIETKQWLVHTEPPGVTNSIVGTGGSLGIGSANWAWTSVPPYGAVMVSGTATAVPTDYYEFALTPIGYDTSLPSPPDPQVPGAYELIEFAPSAGIPGYPWHGCDLTAVHALVAAGASNYLDAIFNTASKGYLIEIRNKSYAFASTSGGEEPEFLRIELTTSAANVNVVAWDSVPVSSSAAGLPSISVKEWNDDPVFNSTSGRPRVSVTEWNNHAVVDSTAGRPSVNVIEWQDNAVTSSATGVPEVDVVSVNDDTAAADGLEDFATNGYTIPSNDVLRVNTTTTTENIDAGGIVTASFANGAITAAKIATDAIGSDQIATNAIGSDQIAENAIGSSELQTNAIGSDQIAENAIGSSELQTNAITSDQIADDAIDEGAIAIDSLTYDEISDSAIREIVNGIWGASVYSPIDHSADYSGTDLKMAEPGTIGHTMLMEYLSKFMVHTAPTEDPSTGVRGQVNTPMHFTDIYDSTGHKFYSSMLAEMNLTEEEAKSYIDRTAVLVRGLTVPSGDTLHSIRFYITESDSGWDGWNGAQLIIQDEDGSVVTTETLEGGNSGFDLIDLKAGTDYTFMLTHGGAPAEVGLIAMMWNYETNLWDIPIIVGQNTLQTGPNPLVGSFSTPEESPLAHQQHMVRITDVETDVDGQYFRIQCIDEDQSSIPGGVYPTRRDPTSMSGWAQPGDILIVKAETDATMHEVAHEVWEEDVDDHATPDTFGMLNRIIAGLSQYNHQITDSTYDESGRLLACRLVVYPNAEAARNGEDPLTTIEVTSTYDEKQNMVTFKAAEEKEV